MKFSSAFSLTWERGMVLLLLFEYLRCDDLWWLSLGCNSIDILGLPLIPTLTMFGVLQVLKLPLNLSLNPTLNPKCLLNCTPDLGLPVASLRHRHHRCSGQGGQGSEE